MNSKKKKLIFLTKLYKNDFEIIKKKLNKYYSFILPKNFTETELAKYIKYAEVAVGNNITKKNSAKNLEINSIKKFMNYILPKAF